LPYAIPYRVPGFLNQARPTDRALAPEACECEAWFDAFADRVAAAVGRNFLPVCRMSDGEFFFLFGQQPPSLRLRPRARFVRRVGQTLAGIRRWAKGFQASTAPGVSSGSFTPMEWRTYRPILSRHFLDVLDAGVLGIHLSYGSSPFQEHYFPALGRWLTKAGRRLTLENYIPFYSVYALLRGPRMRDLAAGRRLLVVHSAVGDKRQAISTALNALGFKTIQWLTISATRSYADDLDLAELSDAPDICLVGAGIGKARVLSQLAPLNVPCIDAGYAFEAWANADCQWDRPYMTPDAEFAAERVRFLIAKDREMLGRS
jgi:hypothetical protein